VGLHTKCQFLAVCHDRRSCTLLENYILFLKVRRLLRKIPQKPTQFLSLHICHKWKQLAHGSLKHFDIVCGHKTSIVITFLWRWLLRSHGFSYVCSGGLRTLQLQGLCWIAHSHWQPQGWQRRGAYRKIRGSNFLHSLAFLKSWVRVSGRRLKILIYLAIPESFRKVHESEVTAV
jgi:hypothetical protein